MSQKKLFQDCIDNCYYPIEEGTFLYSLDIRLQEIVKRQYPDLEKDAFISNKNLTNFRLFFLEEIIDKANRKNDCVREAVRDAAKPFGIAFDKYPFILLNLVLSTLAAIQAPLIMMSQNRASDYDRLQAKNDYNVNKVSEEGIRLLHTKLDHLVQQDQSDLLEIQKLQTEMLASLTKQLVSMQEEQARLMGQIEKMRGSEENV